MHTLSKSWLHLSDGSVDFSDWDQSDTAPVNAGAGPTPRGPFAAPNLTFSPMSDGSSGAAADTALGAAADDTPGSALEQTAAIGDLGTITSLARGSGSAASGSSTTTGAALAPTMVSTTGSGLVINLLWDSSVSSAPAGFTSDMIAAAQYLESQITTAATVNLDVGYDEVDGSALESGALAESESNIQSVSYASLVSALKASASTDATDASLLASLPATSPVSGTYWVTTAQAKALGLAAANGTGLDGALGFGVSSEFTYGDTNSSGTVAGGTYDFFATALHEMTETMGRLLLVGESVGGGAGYSLLDLMHFSGTGTRDFTQSTPGYFSINGGATDLGNFNTIAGGDAGDWASSVTDNSFDAYATSGVLEPVTANDLTEMDAIGWNLNGAGSAPPPPPPPPSAPTVTDQTATQTWTEGQAIGLKLPANTFTDPQGETLSYTASQANGEALPSWLTFNAATETFSGTAPLSTQNLSLKVTATDTSGLSALETFTANVVAAAPKPGITVTDPTPNQTWTDGQTVNLVLPGNTFTDALGLKMTFAAYQVGGTNVTSWLHFNSATDTFSGKVPVNEKGSAQLEVIAQDADRAMATDLFTVTFAPAGAAHPGATLVSVAAASSAPGPYGDGPFFPAGAAGAALGQG
jgi:hypothetical protein